MPVTECMVPWRRLLACRLDTRVESCARRGRKRRDESRRGSLRGCATRAGYVWALLSTVLLASSDSDAGIQAFQQGRYAEAMEKLQQATRRDPADRRARLFLALTEA